MPDEDQNLAPGYCIENGRATCPCAEWARGLIAGVLEDMQAGRPIRHAPLCDGYGNPTRPLVAVEETKQNALCLELVTLLKRFGVGATTDGVAVSMDPQELAKLLKDVAP
jgi:hypothetical protein